MMYNFLNSKSEARNSKQIQNSNFQNSKQFWPFSIVSKFKIQNSKFCRRQRGFTLIEMIIYLSIVSIILVSISYLILDMMGGQVKSYAKNEVNQNLRFIANYLIKDIKSAQNIGSLAGDTLVLTMPGNDITYNFDSINKKITRQVGVSGPDDLNSTRVEVAGSFTDLSYLGRSKNVGIYLEIFYKNPDNLPDYNASTTGNFSVELRGRR